MTSREALLQACALIRGDFLPAYVRILDAIEGLSIDCTIGEERFRVIGAAEIAILPSDDAPPSARAISTRSAILALIDGELSLTNAVKRGLLDIHADTRTLLRLARAERAFAEGAARSRPVEDVLAQYRLGASETS